MSFNKAHNMFSFLSIRKYLVILVTLSVFTVSACDFKKEEDVFMAMGVMLLVAAPILIITGGLGGYEDEYVVKQDNDIWNVVLETIDKNFKGSDYKIVSKNKRDKIIMVRLRESDSSVGNLKVVMNRIVGSKTYVGVEVKVYVDNENEFYLKKSEKLLKDIRQNIDALYPTKKI